MDWIQVVVIIFTILAFITPMFLWAKTENRTDMRHLDAKLDASAKENRELIEKSSKENRDLIAVIHRDMRDFHGRLERQDAEFKAHLSMIGAKKEQFNQNHPYKTT